MCETYYDLKKLKPKSTLNLLFLIILIIILFLVLKKDSLLYCNVMLTNDGGYYIISSEDFELAKNNKFLYIDNKKYFYKLKSNRDNFFIIIENYETSKNNLYVKVPNKKISAIKLLVNIFTKKGV